MKITEKIKTSSRGWPTQNMEWDTAPSIDEALGHCFDVVFKQDDDGGYVVRVARLRGVVSQGRNFAEAMQNILEALQATIETYKAEGMPIPWSEAESLSPGEEPFRVAVNV